MIFKGQKPLIPYKGDRKPLNIYRGGKKVAGYTVESAALPGGFTSEYGGNPAGFIIEGTAIQNRTPDVGDYVPIDTAAGITVTIGKASFTVPKTVTLPSDGTSIELAMASVDGKSDILEVDKSKKTVKYIKNVQTFVFDGSEKWYLTGSSENNYRNYIIWLDIKEEVLSGSTGLCTHLPYNKEAESAQSTACGMAADGCLIAVRVPFVNSDDITPWKKFLNEQFAAKTPAVMMLASAKQTVYDISDTSFGRELLEISAEYGYTDIYVSGSVGAGSLVKYYKFDR